MKTPLCRQPIYRLWAGIKNRCYNENSKDFGRYGGRGITVSPLWKDNFPAFEAWVLSNGYRRGLLIDRIDPNGIYEPTNCRFVTARVSSNNKTNNRRITAFGETKTVSEWADDPRCAVRWGMLFKRLDRGLHPELAISTPPDQSMRRPAKLVEAFGETKTIVEWASDPRCRASLESLKSRLKRGWSPEYAVTTSSLR